MATRNRIGFELMVPEHGTSSNHFSTKSFETGSRYSLIENETEPSVFVDLLIDNLEEEWATSSKCSSPVGSHWKDATCFSPDSDKILSLLLASKNASGCDLENKTHRPPSCPSGKFLTPTNSKRTWKRNQEEITNTLI